MFLNLWSAANYLLVSDQFLVQLKPAENAYFEEAYKKTEKGALDKVLEKLEYYKQKHEVWTSLDKMQNNLF